MFEWIRGKTSSSLRRESPPTDPALPPPYAQEFEVAWARTERLGLLRAPIRMIVRKDCVDMSAVMPVLLEYFSRHDPAELVGQTLAIHYALVPLLVSKTDIPFQLTIGWMVRDGRTICQHDEETIRRFMREKFAAWSREGVPFHLWLTSPAYEIIDVTYAMNLGQARTREQCEQLVIYQSSHAPAGENVYHPMLVGPEFFNQTGVAVSLQE